MYWPNTYFNYPTYWSYPQNFAGQSAPNESFFFVPYPSQLEIPNFPINPQNRQISAQNRVQIKKEEGELKQKEGRNSLIESQKLDNEKKEKEKIKAMKIGTSVCQCSKSKCMKQYCFCFKNGTACSDKCNCQNCKNKKNSNNKRFQQRKQKELSCNCIWSKCSKKYCECFANGKGCGENCKCVNCRN